MAGCQYRCFGVEVTVVAEPGSTASRFTWHRVPPPPHPHPCPQPQGKEALGVSPAPLVQFNSLTNLGKGLSSHKTRPACVSSSTADGAESCAAAGYLLPARAGGVFLSLPGPHPPLSDFSCLELSQHLMR